MLCCLVIKGHTYLNKPVGKSSKNTKSEVFFKDFYIHIHILIYSHFLKKFLKKKHFTFLGVGCF